MQMRTMKGLALAGLVSALYLTGAVAKAGSVVVHDDSGGGSLMTVTGSSTGGALVGNNSNIKTFEVDGTTGLSLPTSYNVTITDVAPVFLGIRLISATGTSVIGTAPNSEAILNFTATGYATGGFINLTGSITSVTEDKYPGYAFSPSMVGAAISLSVDKTLTNFASVLGHNGMVVRNSGFGFQQTDAVPEPTSMTLLGIGLTGLVVLRRFRSAKA